MHPGYLALHDIFPDLGAGALFIPLGLIGVARLVMLQFLRRRAVRRETPKPEWPPIGWFLLASAVISGLMMSRYDAVGGMQGMAPVVWVWAGIPFMLLTEPLIGSETIAL